MQLSFEKSVPGRRSHVVAPADVPAEPLDGLLPPELRRCEPARLPEMAEPEVVRHFVALSRRNFGVDVGFYPLGSCTMKYNPKINEAVASLPGFLEAHPLAPDSLVQGTLAVLHETERLLSAVAGMAGFSLAPAAGAHGELTGLMIIQAWHRKHGSGRTKVIVPDGAHGTNPASAALCGFEVVTVPSDPEGGVDLDALRGAVDEHTAALMLTNPNTLGLFERNILTIAGILHDAGALLYYDGANLNGILGRARPGDMGFDVVHLNVHKTFSTPHGGGGPGAGPVGVAERLVPVLPPPRVV
ncbi:MAG: aminomethyl-transferring glycine dehydrogenase subunit GcvPB [Armatimonadetes bacterium]|nr:aminomethyl-transferring glycine dehydrogenase subunit GcvPB [Armatimonadota bacterium]